MAFERLKGNIAATGSTVAAFCASN